MSQLLSLDFGKELVGVALIVLFIGIILHNIALNTHGAHDLNDTYIYGAHLVSAGIATHIFCEMTGINRWYCNNGVACKR